MWRLFTSLFFLGGFSINFGIRLLMMWVINLQYFLSDKLWLFIVSTSPYRFCRPRQKLLSPLQRHSVCCLCSVSFSNTFMLMMIVQSSIWSSARKGTIWSKDRRFLVDDDIWSFNVTGSFVKFDGLIYFTVVDRLPPTILNRVDIKWTPCETLHFSCAFSFIYLAFLLRLFFWLQQLLDYIT